MCRNTLREGNSHLIWDKISVLYRFHYPIEEVRNQQSLVPTVKESRRVEREEGREGGEKEERRETWDRDPSSTRQSSTGFPSEDTESWVSPVVSP